MKVLILAHGLKVAGGRSIGINFIRQLRKVKPDWEYFIVVPYDKGYEELTYPERTEVLFFRSRLGSMGRLFFDEINLHRISKKFNPDVVFGLGNIGLRKPPAPQVVLFHRSQWIYPLRQWKKKPTISDFFSFLRKIRMKICLKYTQLVFCQTEAAKRRFIASFKYGGKTAIFPNVVSEITKSGGISVTPKIFLRKRNNFFLFCLTRYYPHKNLEFIADTFQKYRKRLKDVKCILTIDKNDHKNATRLLKRIQREGLNDMIINVGPIKQSELEAYFTNIDAVLLPTLLESFSGTYIEAMHFRRPILTSDLDFAREICGKSALYFDPWSEKSMCDAIEKLKNNPDLSRKLVANCLKQLSKFPNSWEKVVGDVLEELESIACTERKRNYIT